MISLRDALKIIKSGQTVNIEACSYDEARNKMGDRIILKNVTLSTISTAVARPSENNTDMPSNNPWHTKHLTMNFRHKNGEMTKIHTPVIEKLNKSQVVL